MVKIAARGGNFGALRNLSGAIMPRGAYQIMGKPQASGANHAFTSVRSNHQRNSAVRPKHRRAA
ncbi:hypothetical protein, partial [Salipiger aestuarii]|uniref:hypothetical protein n=1 Tax=Salipiger aestuarii TaxID=568098 RepID=UPI001CC2B9A6